ncbi:MAG: glucosaminidase domain-containing protein [Bernardetiaceae bacterium]|nr:glucosaminidase domain-containing protein [Bernardetiaceae bacterium]
MFPIKFEFNNRRILSHRFVFEIPVWRRQISFHLLITDRILLTVVVLLTFALLFQGLQPKNITQIGQVVVQGDLGEYENDPLGYSLDYFERQNVGYSANANEALQERFLVKKQLLITKALLEHKVSRLEQLSDSKLIALNRAISQLFIDSVLAKSNVQTHVYDYFTDTSDLRKIETALMEQVKFNIPASIKLSQSALETAYGQRIVGNNYFGIKARNAQSYKTLTTEYYTPEDFEKYRPKVISYEKVERQGRTLYRCKIQDAFTAYQTPWESFRAHSVFLHENLRYSPLFIKGKDFKAWAERIGSSEYGGVGYATSPVYGELLKKIILRYHLHLLDH